MQTMIAFTYPGQGSQFPGMGSAWADEPSWELVEEASEATGRDLEYLLLQADAEVLRQTRNSQLATFVSSMVVLDALARVGLIPQGHAGHSLGEYTALAASGALDFAEASYLVAERGEAMQMASEEREGTMLALLGLPEEDAAAVCEEVPLVWVANSNAPGQVVIAGAPECLENAGELAKQRGAKRVVKLAVGGAFHTPMMSSAYERLTKAIARTSLFTPDAPVYANVDASPYQSGDPWPDLLSRQLTSPVRWRQTVERMLLDGYDTFLEIGPGSALTGMLKRVDRSVCGLSVAAPADIDPLLEAIGVNVTEEGAGVDGELLYAFERLVVSPTSGVFALSESAPKGTTIKVGAVLGEVNGEEVRSPFGGVLMDYMASEGQRVIANQPLAWLRTS